MRTLVRILLVIALLVLHVSVLYAVLHPKVSREYRAYFIDKTSRDWKVERYHATPQEGIDLAHEGLPDFVDYSYGISWKESVGRWTDTNMGLRAGFRFKPPLQGPACLQLRLGSAAPMLNQNITVRFGEEQKEEKIVQQEVRDYQLDFEKSGPVEEVELVFPKDLPRAGADDGRHVGLYIAGVQVLPQGCPASSLK